MTDRAKKITELDTLTSPALVDLLIIEDDPSGTPITKKVTVNNLLNGGLINTSSLSTANTTKAGVIKVGDNLTVNASGFLSVNLSPYVNTAQLDSYAYVNTAQLSSNLSNYVNTAQLSSNLSNYVTGSDLSANLASYALSSDLSDYALANQHPVAVQRVLDDEIIAANTAAKFIFCDPNSVGANITVQLPNTGINDGREFIVKNINSGGNIVTVEVPGLQIEGLSGLESNVELSNTSYTGHWVWDELSTVYRAVNIYTP
jgi:hypothetical protein